MDTKKAPSDIDTPITGTEGSGDPNGDAPGDPDPGPPKG
jgi:hypothetical protein